MNQSMSEPSKPLVNKASSISRMAMLMTNDPLHLRLEADPFKGILPLRVSENIIFLRVANSEEMSPRDRVIEAVDI